MGMKVDSPFSPVFDHFEFSTREPRNRHLIPCALKHLQEFRCLLSGIPENLIPAFIHCFERRSTCFWVVFEVICRYIVFSWRVIVIDDSDFFCLDFLLTLVLPKLIDLFWHSSQSERKQEVRSLLSPVSVFVINQILSQCTRKFPSMLGKQGLVYNFAARNTPVAVSHINRN